MNTRVSKEYDTYRMYVKSETIKLSDEGSFSDIPKKNFEILKQTIALRAVPQNAIDLKKARSVKAYGSRLFIGRGYVWEFDVETIDAFVDGEDPVGLLVKELNGIVLPSGDVLRTGGDECNIEFIKGNFDADRGDNTG